MSNKKANNWAKFGIPAIVAVRLTLPFFLWKNPLVVWGLIVVVVDWFDGDIFRKAFNYQKNNVYQLFDKVLDFYGYCFALVFSMPSPIFSALLFFFLLRAVGLIIFLIKKERKIFAFFPNIFGNLFIVYILTLTFPSLTFLLEGNYFYAALLVLTVVTLVREYFLHIKEIQPHELLTGKRWV